MLNYEAFLTGLEERPTLEWFSQRMYSTATRLVVEHSVVRDPATGRSPVVIHKTLPRAMWDMHGIGRKQNEPPV